MNAETVEPDLAVTWARIEPAQFRPGDGVTIIAEVVNHGGTAAAPVVVHLKVDGQAVSDGTCILEGLKPGATAPAVFKWVLSAGDAWHLSINVEPASGETRPLDNGLEQWLQVQSRPGSDYVTMHSVAPPVHQWVAFQAWRRLPVGTPLKEEMASYLPTDPQLLDKYYAPSFTAPSGWQDNGRDDPDRSSPGTALIEGVWEEDENTLADTVRSGNHFWDPDGGYDAGILIYRSALEQAQREFAEAVDAYASDPVAAWWWLGRCAHLLTDLSVPAHVNRDLHIPPDSDAYESFAASGGHYRAAIAESMGAVVPNLAHLEDYPLAQPSSFDPVLTRLYYNMAETADDYDSDDSNGSGIDFGEGADTGGGVFTLARTMLDASRTFSRAELWSSSQKIRNLAQGADYQLFDARPALAETTLYYYDAFVEAFDADSERVRIVYEDGSSQFFTQLDAVDSVPDAVLQVIYLPRLLSSAIGHTAALYEWFWYRTHGHWSRAAARDWSLYQ